MWVVLRQIVKVGRSHLKGCSNVSWHEIRRRRKFIPLGQQSWLSTQAVNLQKDNLVSAIKDKPALHDRIKLNPEIEDLPYMLTKEQQDLIIAGSDENIQKFNQLLLTLQTCRETGKELPDTIKLDDFSIMLNLGYSKICKHLSYLMKAQYQGKKEAEKKAANLLRREQTKKERDEHLSKLEHPWLESVSLMVPINKPQMNCFYNYNSFLGLQFGQKVIIDCSYNLHMDDYCLKLTAKQILLCHYDSRRNRRPFSLHICNLDHDSRLMYYLQKLHPGFQHNNSIGIHSKSYLELFDRKKIVYLTPHSKNELEYNPEDIYIIGGFVDKKQVTLSRAKADKETLRHASLPLNRYVKWKTGTKSLCLNQVLNILLDVKNTGNWSEALKTHVPVRKQGSIPSQNLLET